MIAALVLTAALAAPSTHTVQAVSTATDNVWTPPTLNAQPGDTIQWNLDTPAHPGHAPRRLADRPGGRPRTPARSSTMLGATGRSEVLNDVGTYEFFCKIHAASMAGSITVTAEEAYRRLRRRSTPGPPRSRTRRARRPCSRRATTCVRR